MSVTNSNNNGGGGIGLCGALTVAFIVLKLCKVIDWSWVWVLAPTWIPITLVVVIAVVVAMIRKH